MKRLRSIKSGYAPQPGDGAQHALVTVVILSIFAIAAVLALAIPQAFEIAATHANGAPSMLTGTGVPEEHSREARKIDLDAPVF